MRGSFPAISELQLNWHQLNDPDRANEIFVITLVFLFESSRSTSTAANCFSG
jgi:hypothetical protein